MEEEKSIIIYNQNKKQKLVLVVVIFIMCLVMLLFINQKEGYHPDEIFSYGSSNSRYENIFWSYREKTPMHHLIEEKIFQDGNIFDWIGRIKYFFIDHKEEKDKFINQKISEEEMIWRTSKEAEEYMKAGNNRFNYMSVYYNQVQDVHPPLFYAVVHTVCSFFNNSFSKYIIFFINVPFFIMVCILIWKILNLLGKEKVSILGVVLYGLSVGGISSMMFLRMYMMLTFFTILFLYINLKIIKSNMMVDKKSRIMLTLVPILGFLTQYFFAIYAFLVFIIMIIFFIKKQEYKQMKRYISSIVISAIIGIFIFPFSIGHMLWSDRGVSSFEKGNFFLRIIKYFNLILTYFGSKWEILTAFLVIAILADMINKRNRSSENIIIFIPAIIFIIMISYLAEYIELRYVMNILPIIAIMITLSISSIFENEKYNEIIAIVAVLLLIGYGFVKEKPLYLYKGYNNYIEISEKYKDDDLVYVGYTFFNHMQSMPEFMNYRKTFMIYNDQLDFINQDDELKDKNEFILSVNWSMDPEKTVEEVVRISGFSNYEMIYYGCDEIEQTIYRIYK